MHQHSHSSSEYASHNRRSSGFVMRHLILLAIALAALAGLSFFRQDTSDLTAGTAALILAHLAVILVILILARGLPGAFLLRMHGHGTLEDMPHNHGGHTDELAGELATEGVTISQARMYDVLVRFLLMGEQRAYIESAVKLANIQPGEKVLDVGCGTGTLAIAARQAAPPSAQIYGQDASPDMIARARQKASQMGVKVDFQPGLIEAIKTDDGTFDLVMNSFMVHHLPGDLKATAFAEVYRVLKPGGRLMIVDFEPPKNPIVKSLLSLVLGQGMMMIDNSMVPSLLSAAGFKDIHMKRTGSRLATCISAVKPA